MPEFIDWAAVRDRRAVLERLAAILDAGGRIVAPTESGPALVARADRDARLHELPRDGVAWSLAFPDDDAAVEWVRAMPAVVGRLIRRAWPGPLVIETDAPPPWPLAASLAGFGRLPLRRPAHDSILSLIEFTEAPMALAEPWRGEADAVVEDAAPDVAAPPTRIAVEGNAWRVTAPGAYAEDELRRLSACMVLFVCTGNTCRSPMAEAIFKAMLAERLGCPVAELPERGWWVMSAGIAATSGDESAAQARQAAAAHGGDLSGHRSRPLRPELGAAADHVVAMTRSHLFALGQLPDPHAPVPRLLCGDADLPDPVGGDQAVYDACAALIHARLADLLAEVTHP